MILPYRGYLKTYIISLLSRLEIIGPEKARI